MPYVPADETTLVPGLVGNAATWQTLVDNDEQLYRSYAPQVVCSEVDLSTLAGAATTLTRFLCLENDDNANLNVRVRWRVSGGATATMTILVDGASIGTTTTISAVYVTSNVSGVPTGSGKRVVQVQFHISAGAGTVEVQAVEAYLVPGGPAAGVLASGYIRHHTGWYTTDQPVSREVVQRLLDNPSRIAIDRRACLLSALDDEVRVVRYATASATLVTVFRGLVLHADKVVRTVRIAVYLVAPSGGTPTGSVTFGGYTQALTAAGWTEFVAELPVGGAWLGIVLRRSAGAGSVAVTAVQVMRET